MQEHKKYLPSRAALKEYILFIDRDGVINQDNGYTFKLSDLRILNGVIEGLQAIGRLKYKIIIITNQSGIARGLFKENEFHKFMKKLT